MTISAISSPPSVVESRDPATGEVWRQYPAGTSDDVRDAVGRAREAQRTWGALPVRQRARVLERFRRALFARRHEVADALTRETGKPLVEALGSEVLIALDYAHFYAGESRRLFDASWITPTSLSMWRKRVRVEHVPLGVVAVVSPWNYPFMLAAGVVLPALVAGNAVLLKPSELTPTSGALLGELLAEAGAPSGVMTVVQGAGATGAALVASAVDKVFFTGSVATGRKVALACAERLIPCSLELGGSDPAIVLEDADVAHASRGIAWGRFTNAGQTCVAPKRVFVVGAAYEPFLAALTLAVESLRAGPSSGEDAHLGPLIHPGQRALLEAQLADALERGARVVARGTAPTGDGSYFPPTLLADVTPEMRVMREETFGPLLPVVGVRDEDDAVGRANESEFGLSASVWSRDAERARAVAERIEAGTVAINDVAIVAGMADVPHGGVKASGSGRSHGSAGLLECVRTQTLIADRFGGWAQPWWFGG
ncbi:MAG TPA: aldehyde dehydrogenase family protein, partial [Gemmatimonadaceae bacterium]|nr:aldehyde dehydrogenase family protein [Gemmatimonadaceae bacterium]